MEENKPSQFSYNLEKDVLDIFRSYRNKSGSSDVTICCSTEANSNKVVYTQGHKMILSAASPVIKDMFLNNSKLTDSTCSFIYLVGISQPALFFLLNYIYNGEVNVPKEFIESFTAAAKQLQIKLVETEPYENANVQNNVPVIGNTISIGQQIVHDKMNNGNSVTKPAIETSNVQQFVEPKVEANMNLPLFPGLIPKKEKSKKKNIKTEPGSTNTPKEKIKKDVEKIPKMAKSKSPSKNDSPKKEAKQAGPEATAASVAVWKEWKELHTCSDEKGFHCLRCPETKSFTLSGNLSRHYKQTHEQICKLCKFPFLNEVILQQHVEATHEFKCPTCDKSFTMKGNLQRHQKKGCNDTNLPDIAMKQESMPVIADAGIPHNETPTFATKEEPRDVVMKEENFN